MANIIDQQSLQDNSSDDFGATIAFGEKLAQSFKPLASAKISLFQVRLQKTENPTDAVRLGIYDNNAGVPGNLLANADATIAGSTLTDLATEYDFNFTNGPSLTSGTIYFAVLDRTGSLDNTNHYQVDIYNKDGTLIHN